RWLDVCRDKLVVAAAQRLIDTVADHRHLRQARIVLLWTGGKTPDGDGRLELGHARKANARDWIGLDRPDFLVELNAEAWWDQEPDPDQEADRPAADAWRGALVDHELSHCSVTVAGRYVKAEHVAAFVVDVGADHVQTHLDRRDEKGRALVRYWRRRGPIKPGQADYHAQPLAWRMRKHDVEEFSAVAGRWGWRAIGVAALVDVMDRPDEDAPGLFDPAADEAVPAEAVG
ncbi:MAG TPA: putative metallopeptidase, partial [Phycisphaerae bacterium]|nr:putative metallopeptidase [Phycisphaerae bacterium]